MLSRSLFFPAVLLGFGAVLFAADDDTDEIPDDKICSPIENGDAQTGYQFSHCKEFSFAEKSAVDKITWNGVTSSTSVDTSLLPSNPREIHNVWLLAGDMDLDGVVEYSDFLEWNQLYTNHNAISGVRPWVSPLQGDLGFVPKPDGDITGSDLFALSDNYGPLPPSSIQTTFTPTGTFPASARSWLDGGIWANSEAMNHGWKEDNGILLMASHGISGRADAAPVGVPPVDSAHSEAASGIGFSGNGTSVAFKPEFRVNGNASSTNELTSKGTYRVEDPVRISIGDVDHVVFEMDVQLDDGSRATLFEGNLSLPILNGRFDLALNTHELLVEPSQDSRLTIQFDDGGATVENATGAFDGLGEFISPFSLEAIMNDEGFVEIESEEEIDYVLSVDRGFATTYQAAKPPSELILGDIYSTPIGGNIDQSVESKLNTWGFQNGDTDFSGDVTESDFKILEQNFGRPGLWNDGDFDLSGNIAFADFLILNSNFSRRVAAVPEPSVFPTLFVALVFLTFGRLWRTCKRP